MYARDIVGNPRVDSNADDAGNVGATANVDVLWDKTAEIEAAWPGVIDDVDAHLRQ